MGGLSVVVNPGSGPVNAASYENAAFNICVFANEIGATVQQGGGKDRGDGRWVFGLTKDGRVVEIAMPGAPIGAVRYVGDEDQSAWDFPRLYVDGSSWLWEFAARVCFRGDDE